MPFLFLYLHFLHFIIRFSISDSEKVGRYIDTHICLYIFKYEALLVNHSKIQSIQETISQEILKFIRVKRSVEELFL